MEPTISALGSRNSKIGLSKDNALLVGGQQLERGREGLMGQDSGVLHGKIEGGKPLKGYWRNRGGWWACLGGRLSGGWDEGKWSFGKPWGWGVGGGGQQGRREIEREGCVGGSTLLGMKNRTLSVTSKRNRKLEGGKGENQG